MKRLLQGAFGVGVLFVLSTAPAAAQAVRVRVDIRTPRVGARVVYAPRPAPRWRGHRVQADWVFVAHLNARELVLYREFVRHHPRYRYDIRARDRLRQQDRAAWERRFRVEQREAEREFRKWMHDRDRGRRP